MQQKDESLCITLINSRVHGSISMNHLLRLQLIHSTLKIHFIILHKSIYVTFSTATAYCYVAQRTIDSWFGILIQVKPSGLNLETDTSIPTTLLLVSTTNSHASKQNLEGGSSIYRKKRIFTRSMTSLLIVGEFLVRLLIGF